MSLSEIHFLDACCRLHAACSKCLEVANKKDFLFYKFEDVVMKIDPKKRIKGGFVILNWALNIVIYLPALVSRLSK